MSSMDPLMIATGLLKLLVNVMSWMLIIVHPAMKIAKEIFEPQVSLTISKEAEDTAWDWVNNGYADIKTAHDLALMGSTVQEFNNDLLAAKRDNEELDWECFKATFLGVGA